MARAPRLPALSLPQPWAGLVASGVCPLINQGWPISYRGGVLIHASEEMDDMTLRRLGGHRHPIADAPSTIEVSATMLHRGGLVGAARIASCVRTYESGWFAGPFGVVFANACELPFTPCRGGVGLFDVAREEPGLVVEMILADLRAN